MRQIGEVLISDEAWNTRFACDLKQCHGKCCMYGDLGAPISEEEELKISTLLDQLAPKLSRQRLSFLRAGISETHRGERHIREIKANTPCPLSFKNEQGVILCSLHDYALEKSLPLLEVKPLWCSLFPVILKKTGSGWMINCHIPDFCRSKPDAPPLLLSFANLLAEFFGKDWVELVKQEYKL